MEKSEALQHIARLEAEIENYKKVVNKPDVPSYEDVVKKVGRGMCFFMDYPTGAILERERLRRKWLYIAEFVNEEWECEYSEKYYSVYYDNKLELVQISSCFFSYNRGVIKFKSEAAAREALRIMGEEDWLKMHGIK